MFYLTTEKSQGYSREVTSSLKTNWLQIVHLDTNAHYNILFQIWYFYLQNNRIKSLLKLYHISGQENAKIIMYFPWESLKCPGFDSSITHDMSYYFYRLTYIGIFVMTNLLIHACMCTYVWTSYVDKTSLYSKMWKNEYVIHFHQKFLNRFYGIFATLRWKKNFVISTLCSVEKCEI